MIRSLIVTAALVVLCGCPGEPAGPGSETPARDATGAGAPAVEQRAAAQPAGAQVVEASGTLTHDGQTIEVVAAVAVWVPDDASVKVTFLPFEPTPEEVATIQAGQAFQVVWRRDDQGIQGFTDRCPFAQLTVGWNFNEEEQGNLDKAFCHLYVAFLGEAGSNMNLNWGYGSSHTMTVDGELAAGADLRLSCQGEDTIGDSQIGWDVTFAGPVLPMVASE